MQYKKWNCRFVSSLFNLKIRIEVTLDIVLSKILGAPIWHIWSISHIRRYNWMNSICARIFFLIEERLKWDFKMLVVTLPFLYLHTYWSSVLWTYLNRYLEVFTWLIVTYFIKFNNWNNSESMIVLSELGINFRILVLIYPI